SSRRRHTRFSRDWSSDVCSSDLIKSNQLFLCYQPQVDQNGDICGLEALVRWKHPAKGFISPADFIPIAEETGQIAHLGKWVTTRSEERRVGKEDRDGWWPYNEKQ